MFIVKYANDVVQIYQLSDPLGPGQKTLQGVLVMAWKTQGDELVLGSGLLQVSYK